MTAETVGHATRDSETRWHASPRPSGEMPRTTSMCGTTHVFFNDFFFSYSHFFSPTHCVNFHPQPDATVGCGKKALLAIFTSVGKRDVLTLHLPLSDKIASCPSRQLLPPLPTPLACCHSWGQRSVGSRHRRPVSGLTINCVALRPCGLWHK